MSVACKQRIVEPALVEVAGPVAAGRGLDDGAEGPPAFVDHDPESGHIHAADTTVLICWSETISAAFARLRTGFESLSAHW